MPFRKRWNRLFAVGLAFVGGLVTLPMVVAHADEQPFPTAKPEDVGINLAALERLKVRATQGNSDAVVVVKDGKIVADWTFEKPVGPIEAMSATKSIVNLAIGRLIDQKKIESLDQPVSDFYPEWKQGRKRLITVRHLLNHTSGLQDNRQAGEVHASPDHVQFALAAEMSDDPGARFFYSNKAVNLLSGIVLKASGRRMDVYIGEEIFRPMGITDFSWSLDKAGNAQGYAGLQIRAVDLAKIGQVTLDGGTWRGARIVSEDWVRLSTAGPGQPHDPTSGLLWWLIRGPESFEMDDAMIADLKAEGLTEESLKKIEALKGKRFDMQGFWTAMRPILREDKVLSGKLKELNDRLRTTGRPGPKRVAGPIEGFSARGYRGQFLVVLPGRRIVAVRQLRAPKADSVMTDDFNEFERMVADLAPTVPPATR
jgi:CubicO group peptidase (beta-lactamase class C family)